MGGKTEEDSYVVRMFKGNMHFTLGRTESYSSAKRKAEDLGYATKDRSSFKRLDVPRGTLPLDL